MNVVPVERSINTSKRTYDNSMDKLENDLNTISEPSESRINNAENSQELQEEPENTLHGEEEQREKLLQLPLGRIKTIIKTDPEVHLINQEAVFLIAKSTVNVIR